MHLLILDGHGSHVTLKATEQTKEFDYFTFTYISCSLAFKCGLFQAFQYCFHRYTIMVKRNNIKLNKITLVGCVDKALDQAITRKNTMLGFKGTRILPLNPKAMDAKIGPNIIYTLQNQAREEEELEQECRNPSFGLATKAKGLQGCGPKGSP
jgi:hypothetical protein